MKKSLKKVLSVLVVGVLMITSIVGFSVTSFAASDSSEDSVSASSSYCVFNVGTESELRNALNCANSGDCIQFYNDIEVSRTLYVNNAVTINLNYHSLKFVYSSDGLVINSGYRNCVYLWNGRVHASVDSDAAVSVRRGDLSVYNCSIYAGDSQYYRSYAGNAIYCSSSFSQIWLDYVYLQGGNGYRYSSRAGKAIYSYSQVYSIGSGYTVVNGNCMR